MTASSKATPKPTPAFPATPRATLETLAYTPADIPIPDVILDVVLASPPFISSRSLINLRDLGRVPGSPIPPGRYFRSATLEYTPQDPEGLAWICDNITRVFDFRRRYERTAHPSPRIPGIEIVCFDEVGRHDAPVLTDFLEGDGREEWKRQYLIILDVYKQTIRAVLEHVRDRPTEPFLFHCTAGRDRTGVMSGLLQTLAGTAPDNVILDFMLSRLGTEQAREKLTAFALASVGGNSENTPGFFNMIELRPASWMAFEQGVREVYGGWDEYVTGTLGFTDEDLQTIKRNLRG